jgi:hypothetical protein
MRYRTIKVKTLILHAQSRDGAMKNSVQEPEINKSPHKYGDEATVKIHFTG